MSYTSTRAYTPDVLPFEVARIEAEADRRPLEPRLPWLSDAVGLLVAVAALGVLFA